MMNPSWTIFIFISMKSENIPSYFYIFKKKCVYLFSWVSSVTQLCSTLCDPMDCSTPGSLVHYQLPDLAQTHVHWVTDAIQSYLLSPPYPPAFNVSSIRIFSSESVLCIRWPKYWSLSFSISPSNECWGLIPFRVDWFDLLAAQGTLKSLLKNYLFIKNYYLFLAVLCLPCDMWAFSRCSKGWGPLFSCGGQPSCCGGFSCCGAQAVGAGSAVVVQKLSCSEACAIFLEGESNLCPWIGRWIPNHWITVKVLFIYGLT